MKSDRTDPRIHAAEGDERIRTAVPVLGTSYTESGPGERDGYVYFAQEMADPDGPIKIGWTTTPDDRLDALRTQTGLPLHLIACLPARRSVERELHARWAEHRVDGEWFRPAPEIIAAADLCRLLHEEVPA